MKKYAEIKRILTEELGFTDLAAYQRWIATERPKIKPTPERMERLSPDSIDCRDFWKVCEELFGDDPVCNLAVLPREGRLPYPVEGRMDANRLNLRLARSFGITALLDENADQRLRVLEIGPGFGSLKNYIETHTNHRYVGIDVCPRIPDVLEATTEGLIPRSFIEGATSSYSYVISHNVFQHLSARQRSRYYRDARVLLHPGGLFIFNLTVDASKGFPLLRDGQGTGWCDHYGQYTLIPKVGDLRGELGAGFDILYTVERHDGLCNFVCRRKAA
jgi:SAM-dependent methyltransferase